MKAGQWIVMKPLDVLFFRDALPFGAGEAHRGRTLFPPLPTTVQGAIRTAALSAALANLGLTFQEYNTGKADDPSKQESLNRLREKLGDGQDYGHLQLRGPFLLAGMEPGIPPTLWFPCPLDVLMERKTHVLHLLQPSRDAFLNAQWNAPAAPLGANFPTPLMTIGEQPEEPKFRYLDVNRLIEYLTGDIRSPVSEEAEKAALDFIEHRFGIQLDRERRTVTPGMFYTVEMVRLKPGDAFLLEVACPHFPPRGFLRLGGEGRAVHYETVDRLEAFSPAFHSLLEGETRRQLLNKVRAERRFKLYLLTPALFRNGWLPDFVDPNSLELSPETCPALRNITCRLVSAAVGKPIHIGGWNMATNAPRPMFKAVPPGSVYFFEITEGNAVEALFDAFHFQPLVSRLPGGEELAKLGFGLSFVGGWRDV